MNSVFDPTEYDSQENVPKQFQQPIRAYMGRKLDSTNLEDVSYIPNSHLRLWYNNDTVAYAEHHHDAAEIIYVQENVYPVRINDVTYTLNQGDILYIPPNVPHMLLGGAGIRFILLLDLSPLSVYSEFNANASFTLKPQFLQSAQHTTAYQIVRKTYDQIIEIYFKSELMWEFQIFTCLMEMFTRLAQQNFSSTQNFNPSGGSSSIVNHEKFSSLLTYIDQNYHEDLTLEKAADYVGFSKFHFLRLFKEFTGFTFHEYVIRKRIHAAERLLATPKSITDIAFETGFNSINAFSRSFRQITGMSPTEYRDKKDKYNDYGFSQSIIL
ncbi:MAG TPA: AraC family transcriptional regulator [Oribacterium sp.]|nr:AraC family transcriptional regulator [Oribacterium sp.]